MVQIHLPSLTLEIKVAYNCNDEDEQDTKDNASNGPCIKSTGVFVSGRLSGGGSCGGDWQLTTVSSVFTWTPVRK